MKRLYQPTVFLILMSCCMCAVAQQRLRYYPPLDLQIKNVPQEFDSVAGWMNAYLKNQFAKDAIYGNGYMSNFKLSMRHLHPVEIMGGPVVLHPKIVEVDSTEEPFSQYVHVSVQTSKEISKDLDLNTLTYFKLAEKYLRWKPNDALSQASWRLAENGRAYAEFESTVNQLSGDMDYVVGVDMETSSKPWSKEKYMIDTINSMLRLKLAHDLKLSSVCDTLAQLNHDVYAVVDQLFFSDKTSKQRDSMLNLMFAEWGGIKMLQNRLRTTAIISGFPLDLRIPTDSLNDKYLPSGAENMDSLHFDIWQCDVTMYPGSSAFMMVAKLTGNFNDLDEQSTKRYLLLYFYSNKVRMVEYNPETKKHQTWLTWEH